MVDSSLRAASVPSHTGGGFRQLSQLPQLLGTLFPRCPQSLAGAARRQRRRSVDFAKIGQQARAGSRPHKAQQGVELAASRP